MTEAQVRLDAICDWVHHAQTGRCTEAEAIDAIDQLLDAARTFVEAA